jgi:hypothetical protein
MMKTKTISLVLALALCCVGVDTYSATFNAGITPVFGSVSVCSTIKNTEIRHNEDLGITKNAMLFEGFLSLYTRQVSVRAYYLFPKGLTGEGLLPSGIATDAKDASKDKPLAVNSTFTLNSNRIELAVPIRINRLFLIEPIFLYQTITPSVTITGKDYSFNHDSKTTLAGGGVEVTKNISGNTTLNFKYLATANTSLFTAKCLFYTNNMSMGGGYSWWSYSGDRFNARIYGPMAELKIMF